MVGGVRELLVNYGLAGDVCRPTAAALLIFRICAVSLIVGCNLIGND